MLTVERKEYLGFDNKQVTYKLREEDIKIGYMNLIYPKYFFWGIWWEAIYCNGLHIKHDYRGKGLGSFFVSKIQKRLKKPIGLLCADNRVAFYGRLGFENKGLINNYYNRMEWYC